MSRYKPYPGYKDSAVEWIRSIPEHWAPRKVFHSFVEIGSGTTPPSNQSAWYTDVGIPWITTGELRENTIVATTKCVTQEALEAFSTLRIYPAGALAVAMYGATIGRLGILGIPATTNQACCVLAIGKLLDIRYMFYWLQASKQPIIDLYAVGGGQPNINQEVVASLKVPAPNMDEQATIVAALDHETARIDALVTKKTTLIELLKEKRRAVITHTITKGLEPYVKMKDSGMEWLGAIPAHWRLMKFGRVARVTDGLVDPRVEPYRTMSLFAPNHIESGTGRLLAIETSAEQDAESGKYLCKAGAVVYSKIRPALAKVIIAPTDGLCSADMYPLTCSDKVEPRWLFYLMLSQAFTAWAVLESDRVAMPKINRESLSELAVAVPPLAEQREVVSSIDSRLHKIDIIFQKVEASIALLRERRSAFITAAVTGQIDLRQEP